MHRKYEKDLEEWLHNPRKKPLVVYGARQVGKTYLIKNIFAETHFKNKYLIDLSIRALIVLKKMLDRI